MAITGVFPFGGNNLALDLVNTEHVVRRQRKDALDSIEHLQAWWTSARTRHEEGNLGEALDGSIQWDETLLVLVKRMRAQLRHLFTAVATGQRVQASDLTFLNTILATSYPTVMVTSDGGYQEGYATRDPERGGLFLPIALSALHLLVEGERERIRACPNCIGLFYDTSKNGTRRWCSEACMNRARSVERYAQRKKAKMPL